MGTIELKNVAEFIIREALKHGADECDVFISLSDDFSVTVRNREIETLKQAVVKGVGIRIFKSKKLGFSHTTDISTSSITKAVNEALSLAENATPEDENELPDVSEIKFTDLEIYDSSAIDVSVEDKIKMAKEAELSALSIDPRISVESSGFGSKIERIIIANSRGLAGEYESTLFEIYCSAIASENSERKIEHHFSVNRFLKNLESPENVGKNAALRALRSLNPKQIKTGTYPVIFEPRITGEFVGIISSAVNGRNVYRGMSFLSNKINAKVASDVLTIIDDGKLKGGIGSCPFDDEGVETKRKEVISSGILKLYLLDSITARKFNLDSTGNAKRSYKTPPTPAPLNFYIKPGSKTPNEIISEVDKGLLVTKVIGFGVDLVSGNYSRGAEGIWIEKGELKFPVDKITIAGNLNEMLKNIDAVGNDLIFYDKTAGPNIRISRMTISGK